MPKPRICFVINSLAGGGAERVMLKLLSASRSRHNAYDLSLVLLDDEARSYTPPDWLPVRQLDARGTLPRSMHVLWNHLRQTRPDVVVSFLTRANVANVLTTRVLGGRCVISERTHASQHLNRGRADVVARTMVRATYGRADAVVAVSQGVADDLTEVFGVPAGKVRVINNPVDADGLAALAAQAAPAASPRPYIVGVGRLTPIKNFQLLIRAFAESGLPHDLVILGEGEERPTLLRLAAELGLADRVRLPGFQANPFPIVKNAAVFASASNAEGFPNGIVEAMALGVPVVAANCPSGPSEILDGRSRGEIEGLTLGAAGVIVPQNDVGAFARALRLMDDPQVRDRYARAGAARARDYSVEAAVERYWSVILDEPLTGESARYVA